jgi:hypothetical protein
LAIITETTSRQIRTIGVMILPALMRTPARSVPDQDELEFLAGLAGLHQKIIDRINAWQVQQKAKPNPNGVTAGPRKIAVNTASRTPGPRGDLLP